MSAIYSFKTLPPPSPDAPAPVQRLLVFGDMGRKGGALSLDGMIEEVTSGAITAVIHGTGCTAHGREHGVLLRLLASHHSYRCTQRETLRTT